MTIQEYYDLKYEEQQKIFSGIFDIEVRFFPY